MKALKIKGRADCPAISGSPCAWLFSEDGQGQSEYILMVVCLTVVIFGLNVFNLVLNKAYLDAMNSIRKW